MTREAVLLMAYGTPERLDDVETYYTHIRRGSPPPAELLEELVERYRAVGGPTALNRITREQAAALEAELARRGHAVPVRVGFKHHPPFIGEVVKELAAEGFERAVALVLAPHYSLRSVAEYERYAEDARPPGLEIDLIRSWHDHPPFLDLLAARLAATRAAAGGDPVVLFTAHSVPARVLESGDPYPDQLRETSEAVAALAGVERWEFAYQSAGRTGEEWLGPDVLDAVAELAARGERAVVLQAIGFVSDHLEVLYDLDVEARQAAESNGMTYARAAMPNTDREFVDALADLVVPRLAVLLHRE
ncbi:MAG TPA: ferrochelatase [Gemmatimonadota bacterium]|nr:ferrochelatase [Gemmatimonadota bacterium]